MTVVDDLFNAARNGDVATLRRLHRAVAKFLIDRGARHHIFSAIAMNLPDCTSPY